MRKKWELLVSIDTIIDSLSIRLRRFRDIAVSVKQGESENCLQAYEIVKTIELKLCMSFEVEEEVYGKRHS